MRRGVHKFSVSPLDQHKAPGQAESPGGSVVGAVFYHWDFSRNSMWWARGLQKLIGCSPPGGASTLEWWLDRIHLDDQQAYSAAVSSVLSQGTGMALRYRVKTNDGQWVHLLDEAVMVGDRVTGSVCVPGSIDDVGRFRNSEQVRHAADQFLNKMLHDMGTPLGSMFIWVQVLRHDNLTEEEKARALAAIESSATMLGEFVKVLVDLSRMIAGTVHLPSRPVQLAVVIASAVEAAGSAALARCVQVSKTLDPQVGLVAGAADRLELLVRALLSNAIAFTPREGKVSVALTRSGSFAQITVSDEGPGIGDDLDGIFEGFPPASKRSGDVGLHLAHLLALLNRGSLTARPEREGSSFTVRIPLLDQRLPRAASRSGRPSHRAGFPRE